jgi:ligand-binding SRPBCC domain-containing protein
MTQGHLRSFEMKMKVTGKNVLPAFLSPLCPMMHRLERSTFIPRPRSEVFRFFADAHNLERITPAFLHFHILTPDPIVMQAGTVIDYELRLYGIRARWRTLIEEFVPDEFFVDVQLSGPYRSWRHRHDFIEVPTGTQIHDRVQYEMPYGMIGRLARSLFVRSSLDKIFDYRNAAVADSSKALCQRAQRTSSRP